ncbi:MAG: hypothetical protein KJ015_19640 [Myxococcales bacterium]|nr:hypothetical protein [Myxococcales bacterium]
MLAAFWHPRTLESALLALRPTVKGALDWMALNQTIISLHEHGVLLASDGCTPSAAVRPALRRHAELLDALASAPPAAFTRFVTPGDAVVDLGDGSGLVALLAARGGASHVYVISSGTDSTVRRLFELNGFSNKLEILPDASGALGAAKRADVVVSEKLASSPFAFEVRERMRRLSRELRKECGRCVPSDIEVWAELARAPDEWLDSRTFTVRNTAEWTSNYGIDFSCLARAAMAQAPPLRVSRATTMAWDRAAQPFLLSRCNPLLPASTNGVASTIVERGGEYNCVLVRTAVTIFPGLRVWPDGARLEVHLLARPLPLSCGARVLARYTRAASRSAVTLEEA